MTDSLISKISSLLKNLNPAKAKEKKHIQSLLISRMYPKDPEMYKKAGADLKEYRGKRLTELIREYINDTNSVVRARAIFLLTEQAQDGDQSVISDIIKALRDDEEGIQSIAAETLAKLGIEEAIEPIIQAVADSYLRKDLASETLKKIDPKKAAYFLRKRLRNDAAKRFDWAKMLVNLEDREAVPFLKKYLDQGEFNTYNKNIISTFIEENT
jgi:HEAT repeat protein